MTRGRWHVDERLASLTVKDFEALKEEHGSIIGAARALDIPAETFGGRYRRLRREAPYKAQQMGKPKKIAPPKSGVKRFIFSSAQNGTAIDENFLTNLEAYAEYLGAEIHIAGFTYGKSLFEDHSKSHARYHERVEPYLTNAKFDIAGRLFFCGEMNILPTADKPLSGFEAYTRSQWGIFPHPRIQLMSIPTNSGTPPKQIMTTGAVTKKNYVQKKAGIKAEFHHVIGAVIVEIDGSGAFFCRHLIAARDGSFQDLTTVVKNGKLAFDQRVEAITWGDIHTEQIDPKVAHGSWGLHVSAMDGSFTQIMHHANMLDTLEPKVQIFHDVLDFHRRNHHNMKDHHFLYEMHSHETEKVEHEVMQVSCFLKATQRDYAQSVIVDSNHDRALKRWLRDADYTRDPVNARFFLECQLEIYKQIDHRNDKFHLAAWAISRYLDHSEKFKFLRNTDSFVVCGDIECAMHGDQGANGAKGSLFSFSKMGPKAIIADSHSPGIFEGIYQVGTSSKLDMKYNRGGLSSWSQTHCVTYPNGKRTLITMQGSKWRA